MDGSFFVRGVIIGFSIAAPVGPIGVLCIRRALVEGRLAGFIAGLGAATADALFGVVAAFGLTFVSSVLVNYEVWLRVVGGLFLCYLGGVTFLRCPAEQAVGAARRGLVGVYLATFGLTLTNPMTILAFTAIFAGLGLSTTGGDYGAASLLVLGVFSGSALWWLLLSGMAGLVGLRLKGGGLGWLNRISGIIIAGFGLLALFSLVSG